MKKRLKSSWSGPKSVRRLSAGEIFGYESYGENAPQLRKKKKLLCLAIATLSIAGYILSLQPNFHLVNWNQPNPVARLSFLGVRLSTRSPSTGISISADDAEVKEAEMIASACPFPRLDAFDPTILEYIKSAPTVDCVDESHPLLFRTNFDNKLIRIKGLENASCCYKTLTRGNASDTNIKYSKQCYPIEKDVMEIPASHEFIYVRCSNDSKSLGSSFSKHNGSNSGMGIFSEKDTYDGLNVKDRKENTNRIFYRDMFAFVPRKPLVEARIRRYERFKEKFLEGTGRSYSGKNKEDRMNVLIVGLDAQSHMNFIRQMPLTYNYLVKDLSAIGMKGYTKVGDNTFPNIIPLLTGLSVSELKKVCWHKSSAYFDNCPFIWKNFSSAGYHTLFAEDSVWMGTFNYEKKGFITPPTDYYIHPLTYFMSKKIGHEAWGNAKLCYGPRLGFEVLLEYIVKTCVRFHKKQLYFEYVWANSLFHDYLNNPQMGDKLLYMTLEFLHRNNFLNNTLLAIMSDHGLRWGSIRNTYQGKIEERMPLAYFVLPHWFRHKYSTAVANMRKNAYRLTTPYDVYETLKDFLHLAKLESTKKVFTGKLTRGISLFSPIPVTRTCPTAGVEEHWCVCNAMQIIPKNSSLVESAANFIITSINSFLEKYPECAKLTLFKVNEAMRKVPVQKHFYDQSQSQTLYKRGDDGESYSLPTANTNSQNIHYGNSDGSIMNTAENILPSDSSQSATFNGDKNYTAEANSIQLQITLVAKPSDAVFEATVYGNQDLHDENVGKLIPQYNGNDSRDNSKSYTVHKWKLSGEISRVNLYGMQSHCINDRFTEKFCYCKQQLQPGTLTSG